MTLSFQGKRALVTGAGKGIGREIVLALAESGAQVVALSRSPEDLDSLRAAIGCECLVADVSDPGQAQRAALEAGPVDFLVNNAGISIPQPFLSTDVSAFDATIAVNLRAVLIISQVVARAMIDRGTKGAIVNVSSQASMVGLIDHAAYCASKGGLDQLTRVMALELGPYGIRTNAVNPTVTLTPMGEKAWSDPTRRAAMLAKIPLNRFATPRDVASAVCLLLSDSLGIVNGAVLPLDGGFLATR